MQNPSSGWLGVRMRIGFAVRHATIWVCLPWLVACGERVVKDQAAASFVDTSQKAVATTQQFYKDLVSANNAYNSFRWAVDPQCPLLSPGDQLVAPGLNDPEALPLAIERKARARSAVSSACAAYMADSCRHESGGMLSCHPVAGTVTADGFFCPSAAAQTCAPTLTAADWKRVSPYTDNPLNPASNYVSLADSDFDADTASITILTRYLDSLATLTKGQDISSDLSHDADALQAVGQSLKPKSGKSAAAGKSVKSGSAADKSSKSESATDTSSGKAQTTSAASSSGNVGTSLSSLASAVQTTISHGGSEAAIVGVLSKPGVQGQVSDAVEQLAKAVDDQFCTTQPVDALRSALDIRNYLDFGYGPNDLTAREALVNQAIGYKALVEANLHACEKAQQANAADPQGEYHPASPAGVLLMGVKKANDALVKEIVDGELSDAERKQARQISFEQFKSAVEDAVQLVTTLKGL
jgi:hypothetical protein